MMSPPPPALDRGVPLRECERNVRGCCWQQAACGSCCCCCFAAPRAPASDGGGAGKEEEEAAGISAARIAITNKQTGFAAAAGVVGR